MTEKVKMLQGMIYDSTDPELVALRKKAHRLSLAFNQLDDDQIEEKKRILKELIPNLGEHVFLQGPIQLDYGCFTSIGENSYANFNFTVLDTCPVTIGKNVFFGPNVSIYTPLHPLIHQERNVYQKEDGSFTDKEYGAPIVIEDDCWIAGSVSIGPGVTIGRGSVIGMGAVVIHDIPPHSLAAGNPARVIRSITGKDSILLKKGLFPKE